jgi:hypothetical protein
MGVMLMPDSLAVLADTFVVESGGRAPGDLGIHGSVMVIRWRSGS